MYLSFEYSLYYPEGADKDFIGSFNTLEEAMSSFTITSDEEFEYDYCRIYNVLENKWFDLHSTKDYD